MNATVTEESLPKSISAAEEAAAQRRVAEIISRGKKSRPGGLNTLTLVFSSTVLMWAAFTPLDWGPLGWVCLVPLLVLALPPQPTRWLYRSVYLGGLVYWLMSLQWMRLGDPTMYIALFALGGYLAIYWPVFLWLVRTSVHRLKIPLILAVPCLWTGLEFLRAHLLTGFAWYFLGHTQYRWVEMIQISDLVGAYGVSFVVAAGNAALVQLIPAGWLERRQLCWPSEFSQIQTLLSARSRWIAVSVSLALVLTTLGYGLIRRHHGDFPLGPRVGLIQGNFVATVSNNRDDPRDIYMMHRQLSGLTVSERPDVIVWPEGMFPYGMYQVEQGATDEQLTAVIPEVPVDVWRAKQSEQALSDLADMTNAALIIGLTAFVAQPTSYSLYNSAALIQPGIGLTNRYDKLHRVPFGEYIPLRESFPFLQALTPFRGKFGIDQGKKAHSFRYQDWNLIPLICFEDTVPHLVRSIASSAKVNSDDGKSCLVNLTNDGWFHGSSELEQHLITAQFRAVETRTPLVRAVNTGISAVIDGDGVVRDPAKFIDGDAQLTGEPARESIRDPKTGEFHQQLNCALVADVPLDPRRSLYVAGGDWFAAACLAGCLAVGIQGLLFRRGAIPPVDDSTENVPTED